MDYGEVAVAVERLEAVPVHQQQVGAHRKTPHGPLHPAYRGGEYVHRVYFFGADRLHCPGHGLPFDDGTQFFPGLAGHLFGIVQQGMVEIRRENDGSGIDRSGERSSPRLIATGFNLIYIQILT